MLSKAPLFNGKTEFDQLDKIFRILGTSNETIWSGFSKLPGVKRITAEDALKHDWFREVPLPKSKEFMPTFPTQHAQDRYTQ
ncbi:cyclin-dependent kinase [Sarracenia purpurea var. burkii]